MIGSSPDVDALAAPDGHLAGPLLRRVGLSLLTSNDEFERRSRDDAVECDVRLQELRRRVNLQAAQCQGQLEILAKEARAEEERRMVSERVARELEAFKAQQRQREAQEDERLAHLYRALLEPSQDAGAPPHAVAYHDAGVGAFRANGARAFPPVLYSAVSLLQDDAELGGDWAPRVVRRPRSSKRGRAQPDALDELALAAPKPPPAVAVDVYDG
eukprot:CAMPEP_0176259818 /NCGR_PEP_ID=MMETSP0121_2-20121125/39266_1 /TAXON_ID=160619 /ORGANISM="Kryptoperidinium foliaceum, Strain CCMP 1326" /LENGTH=214 /DNA_ID=CAMNT_0017599715 /DNA_START=49 /DNA_END=690 /DNA_ORIENTATION=-